MLGLPHSFLHLQAQGIPVAVLDAALPAATQARIHVLGRMEQCDPAPRGALGDHVPRVARVLVPIARLGNVIGPGGRTVRGIQERTGATSIEVCAGACHLNFITGEALCDGAVRSESCIHLQSEAHVVGLLFVSQCQALIRMIDSVSTAAVQMPCKGSRILPRRCIWI